MDIHEVSKVNQQDVDLDELFGPATGKTFNGEPFATGHNVTDIKEVGVNTQGTINKSGTH